LIFSFETYILSGSLYMVSIWNFVLL